MEYAAGHRVRRAARKYENMRMLTLVLIEGEEDDRAVVVEVGVPEQRVQPELQPLAHEVDVGVVALVYG